MRRNLLDNFFFFGILPLFKLTRELYHSRICRCGAISIVVSGRQLLEGSFRTICGLK